MKLAELSDAAFWGMKICLDCDASFDPATGEECPSCGGENLAQAEPLLAFVERLEEEGEES